MYDYTINLALNLLYYTCIYFVNILKFLVLLPEFMTILNTHDQWMNRTKVIFITNSKCVLQVFYIISYLHLYLSSQQIRL